MAGIHSAVLPARQRDVVVGPSHDPRQHESYGVDNFGTGAALAVMTGIGVLLGGAGGAEAARSAFSLDTGGSTSQAVNFAQFDPSLGTLNSVTITLSGSGTSGSAFAQVTCGEGGDRATADLSGTLQVTGPAGVLFSAATAVCASCTIVSGGSNLTCAGGGEPAGRSAFLAQPRGAVERY